jgi:hypothetical protein
MILPSKKFPLTPVPWLLTRSFFLQPVDRQIWYAQNGLIFLTAGINEQGYLPELEDTETCAGILYESLQASAPGDNVTEPPFIPSTNWKFHSAAKSGQFIQFYKSGVGDIAAGYVDMVENDALIAKKKDFIKYRLNWIAAQHPDMVSSTPLSNDEESGGDGESAADEIEPDEESGGDEGGANDEIGPDEESGGDEGGANEEIGPDEIFVAESGAMTVTEYLISIFLGSAVGIGIGWHLLC